MLDRLCEAGADMLGVTTKSRGGLLVAFCALIFVVAITLLVRFGLPGLGVPALLFLAAAANAAEVVAARRALWRAACLPLDAPRQRPRGRLRGAIGGPTERALAALGAAADQARRGDLAASRSAVDGVDRGRLRAEEALLLAAVEAVTAGASSDDVDARLARAMLAGAWGDRAREDALAAAWTSAGAGQGPLSRFEMLGRVHLEADELCRVPPDEAHTLAEEARALGDEELADELDERARQSAYR